MDNQEKKVLNDLAQWLGVVLDCVDYTRGACAITEMVGAVLPDDVVANARGALIRSAQLLRADGTTVAGSETPEQLAEDRQ